MDKAVNDEMELFGNQGNETGSDKGGDFKSILNKLILVYNRSLDILLSYKLLFSLVIILGLAIIVYKILTIERQFQAIIVFMLQEENENTVNTANLADPLSSFLLTRATSQTINIDRIKEISTSQKVITNLLFNKCIIRGQEDYLINHFLKVYYGYTESYFKNFRGLNGLDRNQYKVFSKIYSLVRGCIFIDQSKSSAYILRTTTMDEELSKITCELFYQNLSNFYIDKTTEKAQRNYVFLRNRLDSVRNMLYSAEYQVANFEDRAHNLLLNTARVPQNRQFRNTQYYQTLYGETLKSFEASKVTLNNITPIFQVLQRPFYPLLEIRASKILTVLIGGVLMFLAVMLLIALLYIKRYVWPDYKLSIIKADRDAKTQIKGESSEEQIEGDAKETDLFS